MSTENGDLATGGKALRDRRSFRLYWAAATTSYLGDGVRFVAVPLLAVSMTRSPGALAFVAAAGSVPWLIFGLGAGVIVDRSARATLMAWLDVIRAIVAAAFTVVVATGHQTILLLALTVFVLASCEVVRDIASHALLPALVDPDVLQEANGRLVASETVVFEFVGPAVGGLIFASVMSGPFALDAASFAISAALVVQLIRMHGSERVTREASSFLDELREGFHWFVRQRLIRALTIVGTAGNAAAGGFYALFVLFALQYLSLGAQGYGIVIAVGASGAVVAGLTASRFKAARLRRAICVSSPVTIAASLLLVAFARNVVVATAGLVFFGLVVTLFNVVAMSLRQLLTPAELIGRVTAVHRTMCWGALPIGALLAGTVGEIVGVRAALIACGLMPLLALPFVLPALTGSSASYHTED